MISQLREVDSDRAAGEPRAEIVPGRDRAPLDRQEWLLTDQLGGFSMGTVGGTPSRRYHGLLIASLEPPVRRVLALHSLNEIVWVHPDEPRCRPVDLTTVKFVDGTELTGGRDRLIRFELAPEGANAARWTFDLGDGGELVRTVTLLERLSAVRVRYEVRGIRAWVDVRPLLGMRDFHALNQTEDGTVRVSHAANHRTFWIDRGGLHACLEVDEDTHGSAKLRPHWWRGLQYEHEADRGFDAAECLFCPGSVHLGLEVPAEFTVAIGVPGELASLHEPNEHRRVRLASALDSATAGLVGEPRDERSLSLLVGAADQFVVRRARTPALARDGSSGVSVVAGYPWFGDWGRDTMIALPGLLLATGRYDEAARVLETFAGAQRHGLIPNRFADDGGEPEYNTADASLWFLHACASLYAAAPASQHLDELLRDVLLPACLDVIEGYTVGAPGGIGVDREDGLVFAGDASTQLTWMDAARDGVVFTPRHGKPIELQALWHHGLRCVADLVEPWDRSAAEGLRARADDCRKGVNRLLWSERLGCLADCLRRTTRGWMQVEEVRPNQLFACSLEHGLLDDVRRSAVTRLCLDRLWTPFGVRTLDPADPGYHGRYAGPMRERDAAYHTGTAWPWLLGPMAEAVLRAGRFDAVACATARRVIRPMLEELTSTASQSVAQLFEVYDGETGPEPQRPGGCPAQAWSVSELLRVLTLIRGAEAARVA
ncbi:MAG: amylo-alpha-1,6-glucosidase [Phycisphaerales bacterium]